jgi:hypothetical protein
MTSLIPPPVVDQHDYEDKPQRFYVVAPKSTKLRLLKECVSRGVDLYDLGGAVLTAWLDAGCPSVFPAPSSSPVADDQGGDK